MLTAEFFHLETHDGVRVLRLRSDDGTNRLTLDCVLALTDGFHDLARRSESLIVAGSRRFFSAGADLSEIAALTGSEAREFSRIGQTLMTTIERFPAPVYAAICGYCMGGGLDLALACHRRIASPDAVLAHRGAALGLITGWGGTQRLPRLVEKQRHSKCLWRPRSCTREMHCAMGWLMGWQRTLWQRQCSEFILR